eukprot:6156863-Amphidinium_carterae.2
MMVPMMTVHVGFRLSVSDRLRARPCVLGLCGNCRALEAGHCYENWIGIFISVVNLTASSLSSYMVVPAHTANRHLRVGGVEKKRRACQASA